MKNNLKSFLWDSVNIIPFVREPTNKILFNNQLSVKTNYEISNS